MFTFRSGLPSSPPTRKTHPWSSKGHCAAFQVLHSARESWSRPRTEIASRSHQGGPGGRQGARNAIGCNAESRRGRAARRVAPKAQAAEFAANILPIIRMTGIGPVAVRCPA